MTFSPFLMRGGVREGSISLMRWGCPERRHEQHFRKGGTRRRPRAQPGTCELASPLSPALGTHQRQRTKLKAGPGHGGGGWLQRGWGPGGGSGTRVSVRSPAYAGLTASVSEAARGRGKHETRRRGGKTGGRSGRGRERRRNGVRGRGPESGSSLQTWWEERPTHRLTRTCPGQQVSPWGPAGPGTGRGLREVFEVVRLEE